MIAILTYLFSGDFTQAFVYLLSSVFIVFCILPFHETAHAWSAEKLGDNTARYMGRLTLNPLAHVDWIGAAMIIFVGFGWAKPVPVNPRNFRDPKKDMALTALAGPVSNLLMGLVSALLMNVVLFIIMKTGLGIMYQNTPMLISDSTGAEILKYVYVFFSFVTQINISLAIFNFIPVPPLDGSKILAALLPDRIYYKFMQYERYLYILLLLLLFSSALTTPLSKITGFVYNFFEFITALPFGLSV